MQVETMENVLDALKFQMRKEIGNVILSLDNATVHPTSMIDMYSNIKIVFFSKPYNFTYPALMMESFKVLKQSTKRSLLYK